MMNFGMYIVGQGDYRASKKIRNACAIPDGEALRRVLTVRGRTGAPLLMELIVEENSDCVATCFRKECSTDVLNSIQSIASDAPSNDFFKSMRQVCPNLWIMRLDPVHLCITYNASFWKKRTAREVTLRTIQNKWNKVDYSKPLGYWGNAFNGCNRLQVIAEEILVRNTIRSCSLPSAKAKKILKDMDPEKPWYSRLEYVEALAALASDQGHVVMDRGTHCAGKKLGSVIWSAAAPSRVEWYMNNIRLRRSISPDQNRLLGSGTSPNEALHSEINRWFRPQTNKYAATLQMQLHVNQYSKFVAHNAAMYRPTLRWK